MKNIHILLSEKSTNGMVSLVDVREITGKLAEEIAQKKNYYKRFGEHGQGEIRLIDEILELI